MRPREKLAKEGFDNMEMHELLELIIGSGMKGSNARSISQKVEKVLEKAISSQRKLIVNDILNIEGVGIAKASAILAGIEAGRRLYDEEYLSRVKIQNSKAAYSLFERIARSKRENLQVAYLNARYEVLGKETIRIGTLDQVSMRPREILVGALRKNAYGIIVAHNHPSGDPTPSREDKEATKRLKEACRLVNINLIDHLVVSGKGWRSVAF